MKCKKIFFHTNKSLATDVHIRIPRRIVQVPSQQTSNRTIVPVTTNVGKHALHYPYIQFI